MPPGKNLMLFSACGMLENHLVIRISFSQRFFSPKILMYIKSRKQWSDNKYHMTFEMIFEIDLKTFCLWEELPFKTIYVMSYFLRFS